MNLRIYFSVMIFCALSVSCFAAQNLKVVAVSGGEDHSLVVTENGGIFAAGYGYNGQLGNGITNLQFVFKRVLKGEMNTTTGLLEGITGIGAGWEHSLFLTQTGQVLACGSDSFGCLGNGTDGASNAPVWIHAGLQNSNQDANLSNIICIAAGRSGTHSLFVDSSHNCYATGNNNMGQCGVNTSGSNSYYIRPQKVWAGAQNPGSPSSPLTNIVAVSAGEEHSMALEKLDSNYPTTCKGRVYTWGDNAEYFSPHTKGKLGINNITDDKKTTPQIVVDVNGSSELRNIVAISAGWDHCMALQNYVSGDDTYKGRVYTWGNNGRGFDDGNGRLGNGTTSDANVPVMVKAGQQSSTNTYLEHIKAIAAGESHSMALDANGTVLCWGSNHYGQLGRGPGNYTNSTTPVYVKLADETNLRHITKISAGYWHNLAVDSNGILWVWGANIGRDGLTVMGKLGLGNVGDQPYAVPIEFFYPSDFNRDAMVEFIDYARFAKAWQLHNTDTGWDPNCNLYIDHPSGGSEVIDYKDLWIFVAEWLGGSGSGGDQQSMMQGGEEQQMQVGLESENMMMESEEGNTPAIYLTVDNNSPDPNTEVTVWVHSDIPLFIMDIYANVVGDANITSAMSSADCNQFGWDPSWACDPYIDDANDWLEFAGVKWDGDVSGTVGYFKFIYHSGEVNVSIDTEWSGAYDANCTPVPLSADILTFRPRDPNE